MITKNELKYYSSLLQKKFRNEENKFIIEGEKSVIEGLNSSYRPEIAFISNEFSETNPDLFAYLESKTRTEVLKNIEFIKLTDMVTPQGIAAVFNKKKLAFNPAHIKSRIVIALDNISDPGNVGTILRTCDWFGITEVLLSTGCADICNPKTLRASMGSVFHVNTYENNDLGDALPLLKQTGYKIYCTDTKGDSIYDSDFPDKTALVFSNEAKGASEAVIKNMDRQITIPGTGKAESLNVSTAAGIVLAELQRKANIKK
jgi:TrmH family RNA methyltransferase